MHTVQDTKRKQRAPEAGAHMQGPKLPVHRPQDRTCHLRAVSFI